MKFHNQVICSTPEQTIEDLRKSTSEYKLTHLAGYNFDIPVDEFYQRVSIELGVPFNVDEDIETGKKVENQWIDIAYDPTIKDRYRAANVAQPLHTDDSYIELYEQRALQFFYCKSRARLGGATTFFDLELLLECMKIDGEHELIDMLMSTPVNFEKSGQKKIRKILDKDEIDYLVNWNYYCIDKNNTPEALKLVEDFHNYLQSRIITSGVVTAVQLQKGEAVFFHDDRLLHGRNAYFAVDKGERCLIKGKVILN